ncbi:hypothetical protein ACFL1Y_01180 [Patescibacteria group bacterium]
MAKKKWYFYGVNQAQKFFRWNTIAVSEKPLPRRRNCECPILNEHLQVDLNMPNDTKFVPVIGDPRFLNEQVTKLGNAQDNPELFPEFILKREVGGDYLKYHWALQYADGKMIFVRSRFLGNKQKYIDLGLIK